MDETTVMIYGAVGDDWAGLDAATLVPAIDAATGPITVAINSPGGLIIEGLAIFNALARARAAGRKVTCRIDGLAASMASVIAMAGEDIVMASNAMMMIHNPWDIACGDAAELRKAADGLDRLKAQIVGIYAQRTGGDFDALSAMMDEETWLTASDAQAQGFCTAIASPPTAKAGPRPTALNITKFGFRKAPKHPLIAGSAMANASRAVPPNQRKETPVMDETETGAAGTQNANPATPTATASAAMAQAAASAATAAVHASLAAENTRVAAIRDLGRKYGLADDVVNTMVTGNLDLAAARAQALDLLATRSEGHAAGAPGGAITITVDARDKWIEGASNWLMVRGGMKATVQAAAARRGGTVNLDPGEFTGINLVDLARESLIRAGAKNISRDPSQIIGAAFTARNDITQGAGDFPVLLENVMHKVLQAAYATAPDSWRRWCGIGTVTDFRPSNRYLRGTLGVLSPLNDLGEFANGAIPDGEKQTITASTKGKIIAISRQALINDDMGAFTSLAAEIGRSAGLTLEKDAYSLVASNPIMADGQPLFSNAHRNIAGGSWTLPGSGAAPAVAAMGVVAFDAARVAMASQLDPSNNEILDIRPETLLVAMSDEGAARRIIGAKFDPDVASKFEVPNIVEGLVQDIVGTARIAPGTSGHGWYLFADRQSAPAVEVAFLNGIEEPFIDNSLGWRVDGTEFKVRLDYGMAALNWRSAFFNPGV